MKKQFLLASAIAGLTLTAAAAHAQSVDYGSFEQLFNEPITKGATGIPQRVSEAPATMTILTQDDIRRSGARDVIELMARVQGVDIQRAAAMDGDVGIRGYNQAAANRILVMINGRQIYVDHQGYMVWAALPVNLSEIRQIEIVRSPSTALFGFNAVDGVINIITYNPLLDDVKAGELVGGNNGYREAALTYTAKIGTRGGIRLSANAVRTDGYSAEIADRNLLNVKVPSSGFYDYGTPFKVYLGADALFQVTDKLQVGFEATHTRAETNMRVSSDAITQNGVTRRTTVGTPYWSIQSAKTYFAWNNDFGTTNGQLYVTKNGSWAGNRRSYRTNYNVVGQVDHFMKIGTAHSVRLALEARQTDLLTEPRNGTGDRIGYAYVLFAPTANWTWMLNEKWSTNAAIRLDYTKGRRWGVITAPWTKAEFENDRTVYSYNTSVSYKPVQGTTVRASHARGIQYPNLINLSSATGNPDLDPAVVKSMELALIQDIPVIKAQLTASTFINKTSDVFSSVRSGIGGTKVVAGRTYAISDSIGESRVFGVELGLEGKISDAWKWGLNYTNLDVNDDLIINKRIVFNPSGSITGYDTSIDYQKTTPRHSANAHLGYAKGKWEVDAYVNYVGSSMQFYAPTDRELRPFKAHYGVSGRVAYAINPRLGVEVSGTNITRDHTAIASPRPVDRQLFATLRMGF